MLKNTVVVIAHILVFANIATPALARTPFDGRWSVLIVTEKGTCDRGYRYGIIIRNGIVNYEGDVVDFTGRVAKNGAVNVTVSRDGQHAIGRGRLGANYGKGTWSSTGSGSCSGYWEAERH
jgi:hypothetical protein